jgi:hypothetical protein
LALPRVNGTASVTAPVKGLTVYNTADNKVYYYTGSAWVYDGDIADGAITTTKMANQAVTNGKLSLTTIGATTKSLTNLKVLGLSGISNADAVGALAWNTNAAFPLGLYYWDGSQWNLLSQNTTTTVTPLTGVKIRHTATIKANYTDTVNVYSFLPTNATNKAVAWTLSSDTAVRLTTSTSTGATLNAIKQGGAKLYATAIDGSGVQDSCTITVTAGNNCPLTVAGIDSTGVGGNRKPVNTYYVGDFGAAGCWTTEYMRDTTGVALATTSSKEGDKVYWMYLGDAHYSREARNSVCPAGWALASEANWYKFFYELAVNPAAHALDTQVITGTGSYETWTDVDPVVVKRYYSPTSSAMNFTGLSAPANAGGTSSLDGRRVFWIDTTYGVGMNYFWTAGHIFRVDDVENPTIKIVSYGDDPTRLAPVRCRKL